MIVTNAIDNKKSVDVIYLDMEKAFDRVDTGILLKKVILSKYTKLYNVFFLQNFLTGRSQKVSVRECVSMSLPVLSGVPQGCIISPLLFNVFVNDIFSLAILSKIKLFADDCKIFNLSELHFTLQSDLNVFCKWCEDNKMT